MIASNDSYNFEEAMQLQGLASNEPVISDGKLHRFHVTGDKPGSKNGWYVFFGKAGSYGSWKINQKFIWSAKGDRITDVIYEQMKMLIATARSDRKIEQYKEQLAVAESLKNDWFTALPANPKHPYLLTKGVKPYGLRQTKNRLLVPLMDFHTALWNLQTIYANGEKRFALGGRVSGLFSPIGANTKNSLSRLVICEGWATGASLHEAMGEIVLCALNAGNLVRVAQESRKHYPEVELIIAADNDRFTPGNPGLTKALEAARLTRAVVMAPQFPEGVEGTDYNDAVRLGWRW